MGKKNRRKGICCFCSLGSGLREGGRVGIIKMTEGAAVNHSLRNGSIRKEESHKKGPPGGSNLRHVKRHN